MANWTTLGCMDNEGKMDGRLTWVEGVDGHGMGWMDRLVG